MFEKIVEANNEIEELTEKYKLNAQEAVTLRILRFAEIHNQGYKEMLDYFIKSKEKKNNE